MTYTVRLRTREIGVRMALGAPRGSLIRLAVRDSMVSTAGIVAGLLIASALTRALARMLYEIPPTDTVTFAAAVACAAAIAALGATIAARRATSIDPLTALRVE